jgi:ABC-type transporter lipoprotein component MlaA/pimeloyl-ACP methyl ester carboxylesterase
MSVIGVDELRSSTHQHGFALVQYMPDRIEGFNRGSFHLTKAAVDWVVLPAAKAWRLLLVEPIRQGLQNVFTNLAYPVRLMSLLFQGRVEDAGTETGRFIANTTVGLAGVLDLASHHDVPLYREDFGLVFANWGVGPGTYLVIPILGPSTARDAFGRIFDFFLNPTSYVTGAGLVSAVNGFSFRIDGYETLSKAETDLYLALRAFFSVQRQIAIERFEISEEAFETSDPEPSIGSLLFRPDDPTFVRRGDERRIRAPATGRRLPYSVWLQDAPAPLVFVIPGIGAHRLSSNPVALAELLFENGYSAVIVSSPFHPEFIRSGLSTPYPGFTPSDAEDLYGVLSRIEEDLESQAPGRIGEKLLMGYSLGGIQSLFIAAARPERPADGLRFERIVAINPAVDLEFALRGFDDFFDAPLAWPEDERDRLVKELAMKSFLIALEGLPEGRPFPLDRIESEFLIGLAGRTTMMNALIAIGQRGAPTLEILEVEDGDRGPLLGPINQSSLGRYFEELALPFFLAESGEAVAPEVLLERANLTSQGEALREDAKVRVLTNRNDFILGEESLLWLEGTFDDRLVVFPDGGHLGNLHVPAVQARMIEALQ